MKSAWPFYKSRETLPEVHNRCTELIQNPLQFSKAFDSLAYLKIYTLMYGVLIAHSMIRPRTGYILRQQEYIFLSRITC
jgi:hypothetical protein